MSWEIHEDDSVSNDTKTSYEERKAKHKKKGFFSFGKNKGEKKKKPIKKTKEKKIKEKKTIKSFFKRKPKSVLTSEKIGNTDKKVEGKGKKKGKKIPIIIVLFVLLLTCVALAVGKSGILNKKSNSSNPTKQTEEIKVKNDTTISQENTTLPSEDMIEDESQSDNQETNLQDDATPSTAYSDNSNKDSQSENENIQDEQNNQNQDSNDKENNKLDGNNEKDKTNKNRDKNHNIDSDSNCDNNWPNWFGNWWQSGDKSQWENAQQKVNVSNTVKLRNKWEANGKMYYLFDMQIRNDSGANARTWSTDITFNQNVKLQDGWNAKYNIQENVIHVTSLNYNGWIMNGESRCDIGFIVTSTD